jgi:YHS domain-containing protein
MRLSGNSPSWGNVDAGHHSRSAHRESIIRRSNLMISAIDPVCGMRVEAGAISIVHDGIRRDFCSAHCQQAFLADPSAVSRPSVGGTDRALKKGLLRLKTPTSPDVSTALDQSREQPLRHEMAFLAAVTDRPFASIFQQTRKNTP